VTGEPLLTRRSGRIVQAARLSTSTGRRRAGRFLVEGPQAVEAALRAGAPIEAVYVDGEDEGWARGAATAVAPGSSAAIEAGIAAAGPAMRVHAAAAAAGLALQPCEAAAIRALASSVTPQGVVAVCRDVLVPLQHALARSTHLVVVLVEPADPGNVGTVVRAADAAGADAVVLVGGVDPLNGKAVRASAGSLFHVPVARAGDLSATLAALRAAGLQLLAADAGGERDLHDPATEALLEAPTAWVLGSEAHGVPQPVLEAADARVRIPLHGRAESLNLAMAATLCLDAAVRARRHTR
jgi:TrmH family RNA methyltransferase